MADRSVLVALKADVRDFVTQMKTATKATEDVGKKTKQTQAEATSALGQIVRSASEHSDAWKETGAAVTIAGGVIAAGVLLAVDAFAEFDEAMSTVAADTHETSANLSLMRDAALEAGADTKYSATEAALGIDELAKAGVSTADIVGGGLTGSLALASAGGLEVADSAEIAATALTQFKLEGADVGHVADLLAAGAGKAQGSVADLGMALNQGGLVASQMGLSIEETTGTLAAMASAGLVGSDAGTSLKTSLLMLANPSEKASTLMADLGIHAYDAAGNFVGMADLAGQLQTQLGGLTQAQRDSALATIFGSDAIRAANVLYTQGEAGILGWIARVDDAGYAAVTSATKMDNLRGDLEMLRGALDTALINTGSGGNDFLRQQVQSLEAVVDAYNQLPEPVQRATFGVAGSAAAALLAGGAFLSVAPRVLDMAKNMRELDASGSKVPGTLKNVAKGAAALIALSAAGAALSVYTDEAQQAVLSTSEATALLADTSTSIATIDASVRALQTDGGGFDSLAAGLSNLADPSLLDRLNDTSATILSFTGLYSAAGRPERAAFIEQLKSMGDGLAQLANNGAGEQAADQFAAISEQAAAAGVSQEQLLDLMPAYRDALADQDTAQTLAAGSAKTVGEGLVGITSSAEDAQQAVDDLGDALDRILGAAFDVEAATDAYQVALNGLSDAAKENGASLEGNTDEALKNREAMRGLVGDGFDVIDAMARQGATAEELTTKSAALKEEFIRQATQAGFSAEAIAHYADQFDLIPSQVSTIVEANTTEADRQLQALVAKWAGKTVTVQAIMDTSGLDRGSAAAAARYTGQALAQVRRADGGLIPLGLGGPREDNVLAAVSSGEFVVNAAQTTKYRGLLEAINSGEIPAFADGGLVGNTLASRGAGRTVSSAYLREEMAAEPGPVNGDRYTQTLRAQRRAALMAADAERGLAAARESGEAGIDALREKLDASEDAAQDAIEKMRRAKATDAQLDAARDRLDVLKKANDATLKKAKADADAAETAASARLTAAKDQEKAATDDLRDAENELAEARQRALSLAEQTARSLTQNAALSRLFGANAGAGAATSLRALAEAGAAADRAGGTMRGESSQQALGRRSSALSDLASAASSAADAQRAAGASTAAVDGTLNDAAGRIATLGASYGLAADEVERLVAGLQAQTTAGKGTSLLSNMTAEAERAEELSASIKSLIAAGLDRGLLDQVIAGGTTTGLDMARSILGGGGGLVAQLNGLQGRITSNAEALGAYVSADRYAPGGAKEIKVSPVQIASGKLDVGELMGGKVRLSDPAALDAQTLGSLSTAFLNAAKSIPPPIINITSVSSGFASAK